MGFCLKGITKSQMAFNQYTLRHALVYSYVIKLVSKLLRFPRISLAPNNVTALLMFSIALILN